MRLKYLSSSLTEPNLSRHLSDIPEIDILKVALFVLPLVVNETMTYMFMTFIMRGKRLRKHFERQDLSSQIIYLRQNTVRIYNLCYKTLHKGRLLSSRVH